jgi:hypothetical protein
MKDIKHIVIYYLKGNTVSFKVSYNNLKVRTIKALDILGLKYHDNEKIKLSNLIGLIDVLLSEMHKNFYIPVKYSDRLMKVRVWLVLLDNITFGKYK